VTPTLKPRREPPADGEARTLGGSARDMLAVLHRHAPAILTREQVGIWVGLHYDTGNFRNRLSEIRSAGAIEEPERGQTVKVHPNVFMEANDG
jgi:hypothetical protein